MFALFDSHRDMGASAGGPDGLFDHDARYLSRLELLINGMQLLLLGSSVRDDKLTLTADLPIRTFSMTVILPCSATRFTLCAPHICGTAPPING
jgi:hypothetical protein